MKIEASAVTAFIAVLDEHLWQIGKQMVRVMFMVYSFFALQGEKRIHQKLNPVRLRLNNVSRGSTA
jgi:hypothetical protein